MTAGIYCDTGIDHLGAAYAVADLVEAFPGDGRFDHHLVHLGHTVERLRCVLFEYVDGVYDNRVAIARYESLLQTKGGALVATSSSGH